MIPDTSLAGASLDAMVKALTNPKASEEIVDLAVRSLSELTEEIKKGSGQYKLQRLNRALRDQQKRSGRTNVVYATPSFPAPDSISQINKVTAQLWEAVKGRQSALFGYSDPSPILSQPFQVQALSFPEEFTQLPDDMRAPVEMKTLSILN